MARKFYIQLYRYTLDPKEDTAWVDIDRLDIHPLLLERLAQWGVVEIRNHKMPEHHLTRIDKVLRLRRSLGVNLPGACVILDLLERIEDLEEEVKRLRRR